MMRLKLEDFKNRIEIPVFCALFSFCVQISVFTNLIVYRTCYVELGFNETECAKLGTTNKDSFTDELEKKVEPDANTINLYLQLPIGVICAFWALFVGSWSDKNGRKPVLIGTMASQAIAFAMISTYCLLPGLSPWFLFLTSVPVLMTGGLASMLTAFLSYICDVSTEKVRGLRLGIFEVVFTLSSLIGTFTSSYIFEMVGYVGLYLVATGFMVTALCFTLFVLEESLPESHIESHSQQQDAPFVEQLKEMVKTAFKKRQHYERSLILLLIILTSVFTFAFMSDVSISYLFMRLKFGWSLERFTTYSSLRDSLSIVGTFLGVYLLHKKLKVTETVLLLMGLMSCFASSFVQGLAVVSFDIYFAGTLRCLSGTVNPMIRSLTSKVAKPDEIGKIFAVSVMSQSVLQLIGSPMYTQIYNESLSTMPSLYNFVTASVFFLAILITIAIIILINKTPPGSTFATLEEDSHVPTGSINDIDQDILS